MKNLLRVMAVLVAILVHSALPAEAGCTINVGVKNVGPHQMTVWEHSQVKSKGGSWRRLESGLWRGGGSNHFNLNQNESLIDTYHAKFRCGAKRRYRFMLHCKPGTPDEFELTQYYPSATGWTTEQTFTASLSCNP